MDDQEPRFDSVLTVRTDGAAGSREAVEKVLGRLGKRWHFQRAEVGADGVQVLEYGVKLKRSTQPTSFLDALREEKASGVVGAELK